MSGSAPQAARVRYAPSPTGRFHIGGARTALYNYLLARQTGGQFIIRIEDTDRRRFVPGSEQEILEALDWLGIHWDEAPDCGGPFGPYRQSERQDLYRQHAQRLIQSGHAYYCFCSPERLQQVRLEQQRQKQPPRYDGRCRDLSQQQAEQRRDAGEACVVRFRTPREGTTTALDALRGPVSVDNVNLDDYILLKSDGLPVYHLAAMVDDHLMQITHVLRSSEWLPTFPLHVLIYQAFGWDQPQWVHLSVFLNPSGKGKMSKRTGMDPKAGVTAIYTLDLRPMGYLPEAVNNWLALMGWSYDDHTEIFGMQELIECFSLEKLNPSPAAVNFGKLDHFNGIHIRSLDEAQLAERLIPYFNQAGHELTVEQLLPVVPLIQERMRTLDEGVSLAGFLFQDSVEPARLELIGQGLSVEESISAIEQSIQVIEQLTDFQAAAIEAALRGLVERLGLKAGQLFGILRVAVTGQKVSPPLFETMVLLGKQTTLDRLRRGVELLRGPA